MLYAVQCILYALYFVLCTLYLYCRSEIKTLRHAATIVERHTRSREKGFASPFCRAGATGCGQQASGCPKGIGKGGRWPKTMTLYCLEMFGRFDEEDIYDAFFNVYKRVQIATTPGVGREFMNFMCYQGEVKSTHYLLSFGNAIQICKFCD